MRLSKNIGLGTSPYLPITTTKAMPFKSQENLEIQSMKAKNSLESLIYLRLTIIKLNLQCHAL